MPLQSASSISPSQAINRAGIYNALYYWEAIDKIATDRDTARAEYERLERAHQHERARAEEALGKKRAAYEKIKDLIATTRSERDTARAECERLRALCREACELLECWGENYSTKDIARIRKEGGL